MTFKETFLELRKNRQGALIAYVTGGDPSPHYTPQIVEALVKGGADIVEIGIPFSDPIADGPTIQAADNRALTSGTTPHSIFTIVKESKNKVDIPIALLTYYNILYKMGISIFLDKARKSGVDGLIIPDLPIEEAEEYKENADKYGINTIFLATPSTTITRLKDILQFTSGFLYLVSIFGVTGTREKIEKLTFQTIREFKPYTTNNTPLAVGFGISQPEHVGSLIQCGADGAIVGSAFVKIIEKYLTKPKTMLNNISMLAKKLKVATLIQ